MQIALEEFKQALGKRSRELSDEQILKRKTQQEKLAEILCDTEPCDSVTSPYLITDTAVKSSTETIKACEQEIKNLGLTDEEIINLNNELNGIIEGQFDIYFSKLYE